MAGPRISWDCQVQVAIESPLNNLYPLFPSQTMSRTLRSGEEDYRKAVEQQRLRAFSRSSRTLLDTSLESIIQNLHQMTDEDIGKLPLHLLSTIFDLTKRRALLNLHAWKLLSKPLALGSGPCRRDLRTIRYQQTIEEPDLNLSKYISPILSKNLDFITYLSITAEFSMTEFVSLSELKNLGILEIFRETKIIPWACDRFQCRRESVSDEEIKIHGKPIVEDRLVKSWAQSAEQGAFPVLRILKLIGHDKVTHDSVRYLNSFRALAVFDIRDCNVDGPAARSIAESLGWEHRYDNDILAALPHPSKRDSPSPKLQREVAINMGDGARIDLDHTSLEGTTPNLTNLTPPIIDSLDAWETLQEKVFSNNRADLIRETWDAYNFSAFGRISHIRCDTDLQQAGMKTCGPAWAVSSYATEPVSYAPMVCLRLGTNLPYIEDRCVEGIPPGNIHEICTLGNRKGCSRSICWASHYEMKPFAFFRLQLPSKKEKTECQTSRTAPQTSSFGKRKRAKSKVPLRPRKQKPLGDILGDFGLN